MNCLNRIFLCISASLLLSCVPISHSCSPVPHFTSEGRRKAYRAEMIAKKEASRREGWKHSTVFGRGNSHGWSVMVLGSVPQRKGYTKPSVYVKVNLNYEIVEYRYFPAHR